MKLNFNTIIYPIYGLLLGVNYWDSEMDHVVVSGQVEGQTEHCLEIHLFIVGISFAWSTDSK